MPSPGTVHGGPNLTVGAPPSRCCSACSPGLDMTYLWASRAAWFRLYAPDHPRAVCRKLVISLRLVPRNQTGHSPATRGDGQPVKRCRSRCPCLPAEASGQESLASSAFTRPRSLGPPAATIAAPEQPLRAPTETNPPEAQASYRDDRTATATTRSYPARMGVPTAHREHPLLCRTTHGHSADTVAKRSLPLDPRLTATARSCTRTTHGHRDTRSYRTTHGHRDTRSCRTTHGHRDTRSCRTTHGHRHASHARSCRTTHGHRDTRSYRTTHGHRDTRSYRTTHGHRDTRSYRTTHGHRHTRSCHIY